MRFRFQVSDIDIEIIQPYDSSYPAKLFENRWHNRPHKRCQVTVSLISFKNETAVVSYDKDTCYHLANKAYIHTIFSPRYVITKLVLWKCDKEENGT